MFSRIVISFQCFEVVYNLQSSHMAVSLILVCVITDNRWSPSGTNHVLFLDFRSQCSILQCICFLQNVIFTFHYFLLTDQQRHCPLLDVHRSPYGPICLSCCLGWAAINTSIFCRFLPSTQQGMVMFLGSFLHQLFDNLA